MRVGLTSVLTFVGLAIAGFGLSGCMQDSIDTEITKPSPSGGATTLRDGSSKAFSQPAPNLSAASLEKHAAGDVAFEAKFVTGEAPVNGGLGPLFNNTSCISCHGGDGRGRPPMPGEAFASMLFRSSLPGRNADGGPLPVPGFGGQMQLRAVQGYAPEADFRIETSDSQGVYGEGRTFVLSVPRYRIVQSYQPFPANTLISPRTAPPVFGLGLLEAIPEEAVLRHADPGDADGDGISGKANWVHDVVTGRKTLGRFGWKANTPHLLQQCGAAYLNDMGLRNPLFPKEGCDSPLPYCDGDSLEIDSATLAAVTFYVSTLAVPARRNAQVTEAVRGESLFHSIQCDHCHIPGFTTDARAAIPELAGQNIAPYTDLLVHDMGPALADHRPDFEADGMEWRTPPLWGIGLTEVVNGHTRFLHDGRARNLEEAVLWHGGEAEKSRRAFQQLPIADRQALLAFLQSL